MAMVSIPMALAIGCTRQLAVATGPLGPASPTATSAPIATTTSTRTITPTLTATITPTATPIATPAGTLMPFTATATPTSTPQTAGPAMVNLGSAANYVILSYTGISNSGPSTTCGGYGVFPDGQTSITGSPAIVEICGGAIDVGDGAANTAKMDLGTAYTDAMGRPVGVTLPPGADLGGQTLYPGVYLESGNLNLSSADLTLDAQGNQNAVFIFQVETGGNLVVGPGRHVILIGNAQAANIFWAVSGYCSLDTAVSMAGNIMAYTSVTLNTGAVLQGRALASNGDVSLLSNNITHP